MSGSFLDKLDREEEKKDIPPFWKELDEAVQLPAPTTLELRKYLRGKWERLAPHTKFAPKSPPRPTTSTPSIKPESKSPYTETKPDSNLPSPRRPKPS